MADLQKTTDGPYPDEADAYNPNLLPDFYEQFISEEDLDEFARALSAPENSTDDLSTQPQTVFITALNDWKPIRQRVRGRRRGRSKARAGGRGKDETREGFVYTLLKWPLLVLVMAWIVVLGAWYLGTRLYIWFYEQFFTWRGRRQQLRRELQATSSYQEWVKAARTLDDYLGNEEWKRADEYAYYDSGTVRRVKQQMKEIRLRAEEEEKKKQMPNGNANSSILSGAEELRELVQNSIKNNFVGIENPRLYSQTYYGTKYHVQSFVDEAEKSLKFLLSTKQLSQDEKRSLFKHLHTNFGRTALCLSGGACFAYYHFGVVKALLDANLLPEVITGTSGGALIAALAATRTDDELKKLLVPALAGRITACHDDITTWLKRWYCTGARFDSLDWARRCSWFARGSTTFREAYERTGRILNVTCVPSDPHSPTILANYLTSPDCVIWSAVLASAAVPGILNPVVLMMKKRNGTLAPYSFGHKWKDGSLRTDIPLKALNLHFNVNFSIVSQVNPHINLFFFSSRGSVGRPVTHRRGRGWRGGFLGSAVEQYLKLDLNKWLKVLRHLELLPRPMGQDWSEIWLQRFSGTITIWPKSIPSDFYYILSDPTPDRLARMLHEGQRSTFPNLKFVANRMKLERLIEEGRQTTRALTTKDGIHSILSEDDLQGLLREARKHNGAVPVAPPPLTTLNSSSAREKSPAKPAVPSSPTLTSRLGGWWSSLQSPSSTQSSAPQDHPDIHPSSPSDTLLNRNPSRTSLASSQHHPRPVGRRSSTTLAELGRQSRVFFDDSETEGAGETDTDFEAEGSSDREGSAVGGEDVVGDEKSWMDGGVGSED
ncbi:MAG: hypothetical protein M1817_001519 [Caeruleum heppii]|nr:MAG: hypothetical protein M1817_001519 [Caeruleum heppii]